MPLGRAAFDSQLARLRFRLSVHLLMLARRVVVGVGLPGADAVEGVEVFLVGIGQGRKGHGAGVVVLGVGLGQHPLPRGEFLIETSTTVSSTLSVRLMRSRWRGFSAISSPHRRPVLMAVSTISRCWAGREARMA